MRKRTTTVPVDTEGRLTLPVSLREELGIKNKSVNVELLVRYYPTEENDQSEGVDHE